MCMFVDLPQLGHMVVEDHLLMVLAILRREKMHQRTVSGPLSCQILKRSWLPSLGPWDSGVEGHVEGLVYHLKRPIMDFHSVTELKTYLSEHIVPSVIRLELQSLEMISKLNWGWEKWVWKLWDFKEVARGRRKNEQGGGSSHEAPLLKLEWRWGR